MKREFAIVGAVVALFGICCSSRPVSSQEKTPARPRAILTKPYTPQLGDMIALTTAQLMTGLKTINAPTLAYYDRDAKRIGIYVYGQKATLDRAKTTLDGLRDGMTGMIDAVGEIYGVRLDEKDFEYAYYDAANGKELVHWADGTYMIGEEKEEGGE